MPCCPTVIAQIFDSSEPPDTNGYQVVVPPGAAGQIDANDFPAGGEAAVFVQDPDNPTQWLPLLDEDGNPVVIGPDNPSIDAPPGRYQLRPNGPATDPSNAPPATITSFNYREVGLTSVKACYNGEPVEIVRSTRYGDPEVYYEGTDTLVEGFDPSLLSCSGGGGAVGIEIGFAPLGCTTDSTTGEVTGRVFAAETVPDTPTGTPSYRMVRIALDGTVTDPYTGDWEVCGYDSADYESVVLSALRNLFTNIRGWTLPNDGSTIIVDASAGTFSFSSSASADAFAEYIQQTQEAEAARNAAGQPVQNNYIDIQGATYEAFFLASNVTRTGSIFTVSAFIYNGLTSATFGQHELYAQGEAVDAVCVDILAHYRVEDNGATTFVGYYDSVDDASHGVWPLPAATYSEIQWAPCSARKADTPVAVEADKYFTLVYTVSNTTATIDPYYPSLVGGGEGELVSWSVRSMEGAVSLTPSNAYTPATTTDMQVGETLSSSSPGYSLTHLDESVTVDAPTAGDSARVTAQYRVA
ncbi:MAG: hypothetical protein ACK5MY_02450 [Jhaorihella sp.]